MGHGNHPERLTKGKEASPRRDWPPCAPIGRTLDSDGDDAELHQEVHEERGNGDPEEGLHVAGLP